MYDTILVCLALDHGLSARALAAARALRSDTGRILAIHVHEMASGSVRTYLDDDVVEEAYAKAGTRLKERVGDNPDVEPVLLKGHSGRTITDYADRIGADCIIVGSHKPGLRDFFLGSTAARVVRHAPCAVHVLRDAA